ncbi:MAG: c-type cytochrome [Geminicoccaceae bacterium]|nr:c-type cytochrome [Geminicoccaceae bacterium]
MARPASILLLLSCLVLCATPAAAAGLRHGGPVTAIVETGDHLFTGGFDGRVLVWRRHDLVPLAQILPQIGSIDHLVALPGRDAPAVIATGDGARARRIAWTGETMTIEETAPAIVAEVDGRAIRVEGGRLVSEGTPDRVLPGRAGPLQRVTVHRQTGSGDRVLCLVRRESGVDVLRWSEDGAVLLGHVRGNDIATLDAAMIDDAQLLTVGSDGRLRLWATATGVELAQVEVGAAPVIGLAVDPTRGLAVTAGADGTLTRWRVQGERIELEAVLAQYAFPLLAILLDAPAGRVVVGLADGGLEAVPLAGKVTLDAPARPPVLFAHVTDEDDPGARLFNACRACHGLGEDDEGKMGPTFAGLFGRKAGSVPGYPYSRALEESDVIWTAATLSALFAQGPENYVPGTTMPLQRLPDPADRAALVAYIARAIEEEAKR